MHTEGQSFKQPQKTPNMVLCHSLKRSSRARTNHTVKCIVEHLIHKRSDQSKCLSRVISDKHILLPPTLLKMISQHKHFPHYSTQFILLNLDGRTCKGKFMKVTQHPFLPSLTTQYNSSCSSNNTCTMSPSKSRRVPRYI